MAEGGLFYVEGGVLVVRRVEGQLSNSELVSQCALAASDVPDGYQVSNIRMNTWHTVDGALSEVVLDASPFTG